MNTLSERLQSNAVLLGQRVVDEMYQDPFWQARFGVSGRELAARDCQAHLSCLVQALTASDPGVVIAYARQLQTSSVSRGMCSRHIAENFERLARAIRSEVSDPEPAIELLSAACQALVYDSGPARELQQLAPALAKRTVDDLASRQPAWFSLASTHPSLAAFESVAQAEQARFERDVLDHIAYLADAIHAGRGELFADHALWMRAFLTGRQSPSTRIEETLLALDECLAPPPDASAGQESRGDSARPGSLRHVSTRPTLSPLPDAPVPFTVSAELAAASRQLVELALRQLSAHGFSQGPSAGAAAPSQPAQ